MVALSILVVGCSEHRVVLERSLRPLARRLELAAGRGEARAALARSRWDCMVLSSIREIEALDERSASAPAVVFIAPDIEAACAAASAGAQACVLAERLAPDTLQEAVRIACARKRAVRQQVLSASQDTITLVQAAAERLAVPLAWSVRLVDGLRPAEGDELQERLVAELRTRLEQGRHSLSALQRVAGLRAGAVQAVDLSEVAAQALLRVALPAGTALRESLTPLPRVHADPEQLMLALRELLENAAAALAERPPDQRRLSLDARFDADSVTVSITDSGVGVSSALRRRVFSPLFSTRADHLGVGLWLSDAIASRHGGRVLLSEPAEGAGSCFSLVLPRGTGLRVPTVTEVQLVRAEPEAAPSFTALVLSRQPALAEALRELPCQPEITAVQTVQQALDALRSRPRYRLILCDAMTAEGSAPGLIAQLPRRLAEEVVFAFSQSPTPAVARRVQASRSRVLPWPVSAEVLASMFEPLERPQPAGGAK